MKNIRFILIVLLTSLFFAGCGNNEINNLDLDKAVKAVDNKLSNMTVISDSTLENVYGLDLSLLEEYTFKQNSDGDMYAIIKTSDKVKVNNNMNEYFYKVRQFNTAYSPERLEILDNRLKKEIGGYIIYIVAKNADDVYQVIVDTME